MTVDYTRPPVPPSQPPGPNWWSRNCVWVVTFGCLAPLILAGGCVAGVVWIAFTAMRHAEPYQEALHRAQANSEVVSRLGSPVEAKWWLSGTLDGDNDRGTARLVIPIRGPKGDGAIHVRGTKENGKWTYEQMQVETSSGGPINLLEPASPPGSSGTAPPTV